MFLGGEERFKRSGQGFGIHTAAGIVYGELHTRCKFLIFLLTVRKIAGAVAGGDCNLSAVGHGIARVEYQIHQNLLYLCRIHRHGAKIFCQRSSQPNVFANQAGKQGLSAGDDVIHRKNL